MYGNNKCINTTNEQDDNEEYLEVYAIFSISATIVDHAKFLYDKLAFSRFMVFPFILEQTSRGIAIIFMDVLVT